MSTHEAPDLITCTVGDATFGLPIDCVQEINRCVSVTQVPRTSPEIRGLVNLRGSLVTILDVAMIVEGRRTEISRSTRSVIVEFEDERYGLLVDAVGDVVSTRDREIEPLPPHTSPQRARWSTGLLQHDDDVLLVLDIQAVLTPRDEESLSATVTA